MINDESQGGGRMVSSRLASLMILGMGLVFIGIVVIVVASVFSGGGSGSVGGVILIGPVPIVFGAGSESGYLIVLAAFLTIISIVTFLVMNRRAKRTE